MPLQSLLASIESIVASTVSAEAPAVDAHGHWPEHSIRTLQHVGLGAWG